MYAMAQYSAPYRTSYSLVGGATGRNIEITTRRADQSDCENVNNRVINTIIITLYNKHVSNLAIQWFISRGFLAAFRNIRNYIAY